MSSIAQSLAFARRFVQDDAEEIAGTPPEPKRIRIEIVRPELLPTEFLQELEIRINAMPDHIKRHIPGTRILN